MCRRLEITRRPGPAVIRDARLRPLTASVRITPACGLDAARERARAL
jgi:hypothetical protein